jgi:AAA family ATP:ADP antiporter
MVGVMACMLMALSHDPNAPVVAAMPTVALVLIVTRALAYGMVQPARESLFTRVPRDWRYKGKNAVDTAVWRAGDVASVLSINGLRALGVGMAGFGIFRCRNPPGVGRDWLAACAIGRT